MFHGFILILFGFSGFNSSASIHLPFPQRTQSVVPQGKIGQINRERSLAHTILQAQNHTQQESHIKRRIRQRKTRKSLKPQYQNCQGKNIYQLDFQMRAKALLFETEAKGPCIDCVLQDKKNQPLQDISHSIPPVANQQTEQMKRNTQHQAKKKDQKLEHTFKEKLQKRVIGLIQSKIAETERLKACIKGDRNWFAQKAPKVDWPLMQEVCQKDKKALSSSIRKGWKEMRINLALTSVNPDQIVTGKPNLSFPLKHEVSNFGSIKKLTKKEQKQVKEIWGNHLTKTTLKNLTPSELQTAFVKGDGRFLGKNLSTDDLKVLRRDTRTMQKESRDRYRQILEEMPLLAYMKTGDPDNQQDMDQAFSKIKQELTSSLKKIRDKDVDMGVLLAFKPLVEGLLQESKGGYCLIAERARSKTEKEESLKKAGLFALGVLSAVPCFVAGLVGAVACLGAGLGAGLTAHAEAKTNLKDSLGRALTGKEYERMAELVERDKEKFWELILLPTAGFGTTLGTVQAVKQLTKKTIGKKPQTTPADTKALWSVKPHIDPQDIRIKTIESDAEGQAKTFHIQWTSSNNKEMEFQLEIPKESLEKNKSDIEQFIKGVAEDEDMTAEETKKFAAWYRKKEDLLFNIQKYISQMSEESFEGIDKISLEDLESMLITQYKNGVFEDFVQNYNKAGSTKLSRIGAENVHIKKTEEIMFFDQTEYDVQFKTQKGKPMNLKLRIANEDGQTIPNRQVLIATIRDGDMDHRVLSIPQKMQLAIGQMPAEIFKGLKSITFKSSVQTETGVQGSVRGIVPGMRVGAKKVRYALRVRGLPSRLAVRFPINESLVHAFMKATKSTKTNMNLAEARLDDIPFSTETDLTSVLAHELGHVVQHTEYSLPNLSVPKNVDFKDMQKAIDRARNPKAWPSAIQKDGSSISKYGDSSEAEDFAEAMRVYIQTDGGTKDPEALNKYANRFEILDSLMKASMKDRQSAFSRFKKAMEKRGVVFVTSAKALTHVVVQNHAYMLPSTTDKKEP